MQSFCDFRLPRSEPPVWTIPQEVPVEGGPPPPESTVLAPRTFKMFDSSRGTLDTACRFHGSYASLPREGATHLDVLRAMGRRVTQARTDLGVSRERLSAEMQEAARQAVEQGASPAPPVPSAAQLARIEAADFLADGMAASGEEDANLGLAAACFHDLPRLYHAIQKAIHTLFDDEVNDPVHGVKDPVNGMCTYALRAASAPMGADGTGGYGEPASLDRRTAVDDPRSYRLVEIPLPSRDANGPVRVASLLEGRASLLEHAAAAASKALRPFLGQVATAARLRRQLAAGQAELRQLQRLGEPRPQPPSPSAAPTDPRLAPPVDPRLAAFSAPAAGVVTCNS